MLATGAEEDGAHRTRSGPEALVAVLACHDGAGQQEIHQAIIHDALARPPPGLRLGVAMAGEMQAGVSRNLDEGQESIGSRGAAELRRGDRTPACYPIQTFRA